MKLSDSEGVLTFHSQDQKVYSPNLFEDKHKGDVVRIS